MCDLSEVEDALVRMVATALYPNGGPPSILGKPVSIYRGFPSDTALSLDLQGPTPRPSNFIPTTNVTVFPVNGMTRNVTRFRRTWLADGPGPTTITASVVAENTVALAGAAGVRQLVGLKLNGIAYVADADADDTPTTVAAALASSVPGAVAVGTTLTLPASKDIAVRTSGFATMRREYRRQVQGFRITVWAADRTSRDQVSSLIDLTISRHDFLDLPDGPGRLVYVAPDVDDRSLKGTVFRRDFRITVEYPSVEIMVAPAVLFGVAHQSSTAADNAAVVI